MALSTGHPLFCWRDYFVACWSRSKTLYPSINGPTRAFHTLKAFVLAKFGGLFERWLSPRSRKKALLIGIRHDDDPNTETLAGPHQDVLLLKQLLINVYGYNPADIVVMLDGGMVEDPDLAPTRANILREIQKLVQDAESGDRFVFHFSGHSTQLTNKTGTEEDGMDEAIIPCDGGYLIDNLLKKHLVNPLPIGSTLIAIFDTCHSGSLLDLPHHRCNRVYVPWLSKVASSMQIQEHRRIDVDQMTSRQSSLNILPPTARQPTMISVKSLSVRLRPVQEEQSSARGRQWESVLSSPVRRCSSPHPVLECDGFQLCDDHSAEVPRVIALGACKDNQVAWEDQQGHSMTSALVELLQKDPHPCLNNLMKDLSHNTYETVCKLHNAWKEWQGDRRKKRRTNPAPRTSEEEEEDRQYEVFMRQGDPLKRFQDPQLASHTKLDMGVPFTL